MKLPSGRRPRSTLFYTAAFTTIAFLFSSIPTYADEAVGKMGLKEFSAQEKEKLHKKRVKKVKPNRLFIERKNKELREKGKPEIDPDSGAPIDDDVELEEKNSATISAGETLLAETPAFVDNSKLPSFPPVISQGQEGSCVAFATTYFQMSHEYCLVRGCSNSAGSNTIFSPRWTYNLINYGEDAGAYFSDAYNVVSGHGAAPLSSLPYQVGQFLPWSLNTDLWRKAITARMNPVSYISSVNTQTGLDNIKATLANGHVIVFGTYITSWVYTTVKADPNQTTNPFTGQHAVLFQDGYNGGHAMTIVGYDDSIWIDINANNIVDSGEKGALKIANSWGSGWRNAGYIWMPYDALKSVTAVAGGPAGTSRNGAFQSNSAYLMTAKPAYTPKLLAQFTVNSLKRQQISISLGVSPTTNSTPSSSITMGAMRNQGGNYSLNGTLSAVDGTFVMDLSDLVPVTGEWKNYYLTIRDSTSGDPITFSSFKLEDLSRGLITADSSSGILPTSPDATSATRYIAYSFADSNLAPTAKIIGSSSGTNPVNVNLDGSTSVDSDGSIVGYSWNMGDGNTKTGSAVSHSYSKPGNYTITLTVTDNKGAVGSATYAVSVVDTLAPSMPSNLTASTTLRRKGKRYTTDVNLKWSASTDDSGSVIYHVYKNGVLLATTTSTTFVNSAISSSSTYYVIAKDGAGNASTASNSVTALPR
jgi:C1A family cysteine protease/chitodextrinase